MAKKHVRIHDGQIADSNECGFAIEHQSVWSQPVRKFIGDFILKEYESRWVHCLIEAPAKSRDKLYQFPTQCDPAYCRKLKELEIQSSLYDYKNVKGLFYADNGQVYEVFVGEGITFARGRSADAIIIVVDRNEAFHSNHHGGIWMCKF